MAWSSSLLRDAQHLDGLSLCRVQRQAQLPREALARNVEPRCHLLDTHLDGELRRTGRLSLHAASELQPRQSQPRQAGQGQGQAIVVRTDSAESSISCSSVLAMPARSGSVVTDILPRLQRAGKVGGDISRASRPARRQPPRCRSARTGPVPAGPCRRR